jgi:hypothetical protein
VVIHKKALAGLILSARKQIAAMGRLAYEAPKKEFAEIAHVAMRHQV